MAKYSGINLNRWNVDEFGKYYTGSQKAKQNQRKRKQLMKQKKN